MLSEGIARISEAIARIDVKMGAIETEFLEKLKSLNNSFEEIKKGLEAVTKDFEIGIEEIKETNEKYAQLKKEKEEILEKIEAVEHEKVGLELQMQKILQSSTARESKIQEKDEEISNLKEEIEQVKKGEKGAISQLEKLAFIEEENKKIKQELKKLQELETVKSLLIDQVFNGTLHQAILELLVEKQEMKKSDLVEQTGDDVANVIRALNDLVAKEVLEYDEGAGIARFTISKEEKNESNQK
ncbi:MAG: hypothetical protein ACFFD4_13615 [Candidatus Odinarchaeota archaeon]